MVWPQLCQCGHRQCVILLCATSTHNKAESACGNAVTGEGVSRALNDCRWHHWHTECSKHSKSCSKHAQTDLLLRTVIELSIRHDTSIGWSWQNGLRRILFSLRRNTMTKHRQAAPTSKQTNARVCGFNASESLAIMIRKGQ